jgi:hypothetical protein
MTTIPFIDRLGDAIDAAIAEPAPRRFRWQPRRRTLVLVAAVAALALAAVAIARVLSSPDELATHSIACYAAADLGSDVTVVANDRTPVAACADAYRQMGRRVPALVACAGDSSVAVIPGSDASVCARLGLQPLPEGYAAWRARTARLGRAILALEGAQDCIAPDKLSRSVRRLLGIQGWTGWKPEVQRPLAGPCGTVSGLDGSGRRSIGGSLDASRRVVIVSGAESRSTAALLYGPTGLARRLEDASGVRCFTIGALTALVQSRVAGAGRSADVQLARRLPSTITFGDGREGRYRAGCAILTDVQAARDGRNVVAVIPKARAR